MKTKALCILSLAALLCAFAYGQQAASAPSAASKPVGKKLKVLCSVFPVYLFTKNVAAGSNLDVELMIPAGLGCPHDYALTPQDMQKIASAEVFIVNGAGLEEFLGDPLKRANAKVKVIDASAGIKDFIPMKEEAGHDAHPESGVLRNPHIFAAPSTAAKMVKTIGQELAKVDPDNAGLYAVNAAAYAAILDVTGTAFEVTVAKFRTKKIVTEHAVFDYLARDCGLEIVAVIEEAPGQEPSAAQMLAIIRTIRQSGAAAVFTEPQYSAKVSQTIAAEAKVPVASLDPVASGPAGAALDYYEKTMKSNLETLEKVLGGR